MKQLRVLILSLLLVLLAAIAFVSCGGTDDTGSKQNNDPKPTPAAKSYYTCGFYQDGKLLGSEERLESGTLINAPTFSMTDNEQYHYEFIGWDADGDKKPETFPYELKSDTGFELLYNAIPIVYHYDIYVKGELYASEDAHYGDTITYPDLKSEIIEDEVYFFLGWKYDGVFDGYTYNQVSKSCRIDAYYADTQIFKYFFDGQIYANIVEAGNALPFTVSPSAQNKKICWYLDKDYTQPFAGNIMPKGNLTLWGREEYIDPADAGTPVASRAALLAGVNEMIVNRIIKQKFNLQFEIGDSADLVQGLVDDALKIYNYQVSSSLVGNELTLIFTYPEIATMKSGSATYTQVASTNVPAFPNSRASDFNAFAVDSRTETFPVNTSDALFYALEHGYRPAINTGNLALNALYAKMKDVLRRIVSDGMTDFEKARAIYDYLIMDVVYDDNVLKLSTAGNDNTVAAYNAFYLEGVFNDHLAVCDGLSKAYAALCAIEGIECVRVTGMTVDDVNHAWNKVKLGSKWYVVDVTSGGCITEGREVLTYAYFLLSDETFSSHAIADGTYFPEITCAEDYPVYETIRTAFGGEPLPLRAENIDEAVALFLAFINNAPAGDSSFDMQLGYGFTSATDAVNAIIEGANITVQINFVSDKDSITFLYHKN